MATPSINRIGWAADVNNTMTEAAKGVGYFAGAAALSAVGRGRVIGALASTNLMVVAVATAAFAFYKFSHLNLSTKCLNLEHSNDMITRFYKKNDRMPKPAELAALLNTNERQANAILIELYGRGVLRTNNPPTKAIDLSKHEQNVRRALIAMTTAVALTAIGIAALVAGVRGDRVIALAAPIFAHGFSNWIINRNAEKPELDLAKCLTQVQEALQDKDSLKTYELERVWNVDSNQARMIYMPLVAQGKLVRKSEKDSPWMHYSLPTVKGKEEQASPEKQVEPSWRGLHSLVAMLVG